MNIRVCASMPVKVTEQLLAISSLLPPLLIEAGFLLLFLLCCSVCSSLTGLLASGKFSCLCCLSPRIGAGIADVLQHPALYFFLSSLRVLYNMFCSYLPPLSLLFPDPRLFSTHPTLCPFKKPLQDQD